MNLDMTTEWTPFVDKNHKQAADREFDNDLQAMKQIIYMDHGSREELAKQYKPQKLTVLQKISLAVCLVTATVAGAINLWLCKDQNLLDTPTIWLIVMTAMIGIGYKLGRMTRE